MFKLETNFTSLATISLSGFATSSGPTILIVSGVFVCARNFHPEKERSVKFLK